MELSEDMKKAIPQGRWEGEGVPLLGMLDPLHLSIIDPIDIVRAFPEDLSLERAFELASFLQDPWTIPLLEGNWEISSLVRAIRRD